MAEKFCCFVFFLFLKEIGSPLLSKIFQRTLDTKTLEYKN